MKKIKIENFYLLDIHWLYRTSRYAIVKVVATECNDVTTRHRIFITIWPTSAIEVTALSKPRAKPTFKIERYARKRIFNRCVGQIEKSVPRDHSLTSLGKPRDARQYLTLGTGFSICPSCPYNPAHAQSIVRAFAVILFIP